VTIHYELILLYSYGYNARDVVRMFGYSRGSAYRFHRIYREARKRALETLNRRISVSPAREQKAKHLDHLPREKRVSSKEKWEWTIGKDGTTRARKKAEK